MCKHLLVIMSLAFSAGAMAQQGASCSAAAAEKKLVGTAKTDFMKKCETDLKAMSTVASKDKKPMGSSKGEFGNCGHDASSL